MAYHPNHFGGQPHGQSLLRPADSVSPVYQGGPDRNAPRRGGYRGARAGGSGGGHRGGSGGPRHGPSRNPPPMGMGPPHANPLDNHAPHSSIHGRDAPRGRTNHFPPPPPPPPPSSSMGHHPPPPFTNPNPFPNAERFPNTPHSHYDVPGMGYGRASPPLSSTGSFGKLYFRFFWDTWSATVVSMGHDNTKRASITASRPGSDERRAMSVRIGRYYN